eukprot:3614131-Prorocentrum_lima.AAC.1
MTSSLVGSEMCIRDSLWTRSSSGTRSSVCGLVAVWHGMSVEGLSLPASTVSYTHLTLPTICSV